MSDSGWWSVALTTACVVALVLGILGYRGYVLSLRCQHQWEWAAIPVNVYGSNWEGKRAIVKAHTDLSGQCIHCGEVEFRTVDGYFASPLADEEAADD